MNRLVSAGWLVVLWVICVWLVVEYLHQRGDQLEADIPVIYELTDTYLKGWAFIRAAAFDIDLSTVANEGRKAPRRDRRQLDRVWRREEILEKLRISGFSEAQLKAADRPLGYIDTYKWSAIREMIRSGVPVSITLAQGILESASGQSSLARNTKNHFGIKARQSKLAREKIKNKQLAALVDADFVFSPPAVGVWQFHDDVAYDRFEVYEDVEHSYQRHSDLLTRPCDRVRKGCYAWIWSTFPVGEEVDLTTAAERFEPVSGISAEAFFEGKTRVPYFAAQAAGLKMAGYATAPNYHRQLAYLINTYELNRFDLAVVFYQQAQQQSLRVDTRSIPKQ